MISYEDYFLKKLGYRITNIMAEKNVPTNLLCKSVGVNRMTLARWINMETPMPLIGLYKIAHGLGMTVDELIKGIDKQ